MTCSQTPTVDADAEELSDSLRLIRMCDGAPGTPAKPAASLSATELVQSPRRVDFKSITSPRRVFGARNS